MNQIIEKVNKILTDVKIDTHINDINDNPIPINPINPITPEIF